MTYDCMTADELALWLASKVRGESFTNPCTDCPAWFMAEATERGCCNRRRPKARYTSTGRPVGRPRLSSDVKPRGQGNEYPSDEERIAARRMSWRQSKRLARTRAKWDNAVVGVSDVSATMRDDAASGAYSTGGRVAAYTGSKTVMTYEP